MTDLPTVAESGYPGFDWVAWIGAVAPAGTPKAAIARLSAEMLRAIDSPQLKDTLLKQGISPAPMPPGAFSEFIGAQTSLYDTAMKRTNIKLQ
jgi:tripartite-type tricarboxylate transporter receptor subunit TctC